MLGDLSYIVYLLHWPILQAFDTGHGSFAHRTIVLLMALAATLVVSLAVWKFFDRPVNRLRSGWVSRTDRNSRPLQESIG
jgi:peptidoglycan/LPS O-acetylase OafA/YrhL